jgi:uncharacterized protein YeaO (DUF488 family)
MNYPSTSKPRLGLMTSRYGATDLIAASGASPVGISLWGVRFRIPYTISARVKELTPDSKALKSLRKEEIGWDEFEADYIAKLDDFGPDMIRERLESLAVELGNAKLVLLCFENVHEGQQCHRRTFARWFEERTGQPVPELRAELS